MLESGGAPLPPPPSQARGMADYSNKLLQWKSKPVYDVRSVFPDNEPNRRPKQTNSVAFSPQANYTDWAKPLVGEI
jgi:hypothetical protein